MSAERRPVLRSSAATEGGSQTAATISKFHDYETLMAYNPSCTSNVSTLGCDGYFLAILVSQRRAFASAMAIDCIEGS